jgi:hydrogenase maturation protein HypF
MLPIPRRRARVRRYAIRVRGRVQGVGFRPAVCRLAGALGLGGFVHNDRDGVWIEVEGRPDAVERFVVELPAAAPPVARIEGLESTTMVPVGETRFRITASGEAAALGVGAEIPPDLAPCDACLRELADPSDRRFRYPFINCTACGPRFTIVREVPYDRPRTTMAAFTLCASCAGEYSDAGDRRFHAEPDACPACGPRISFVRSGAIACTGPAALDAAVAALCSGQIVAVKGAGGFVLAADAASPTAIAVLRHRKGRPHKPFAVMARDLATVEQIADVDGPTRDALLSPARPIVLAPLCRREALAPEVAPGLVEVGFFLPPTPLQHLLGAEGPRLQVMTSGNRSDEPIAKDDGDALARLAEVADGFLIHDRAIHTRADDSVLRVIAGVARPLRRARGFVPETISLPVDGPPVLAVGGQANVTVCLARGGRAIVSQHVGDLDDLAAFRFFEETIEKLQRLLGETPVAVTHDLHPDYRSTRWARACGLPCFAVQHHHAHVAACLAEHGRTGPALGVAFDGTGYGPGGEIWGGEILEADLGAFARRGHLRGLALPGGEAAIRAPWRLALAALLDAGEPLDLLDMPVQRRRAVESLAAHAPRATGAGRWFDAVAALCAVRGEISYDGQAPGELEALAGPDVAAAYPLAYDEPPPGPLVIDLRPAIRAIASDRRTGRPVSEIAAAFHETMAQAIRGACRRLRARGGPALVALAGGCFANRRLAERATTLLEADDFEVLLPRRLPAGDGGLAYGQAAVASFRMKARSVPCA